jgi:hypothetical protein
VSGELGAWLVEILSAVLCSIYAMLAPVLGYEMQELPCYGLGCRIPRSDVSSIGLGPGRLRDSTWAVS